MGLKRLVLIMLLLGLFIGFTSNRTFANLPYGPTRSPYNQDATTPDSGDTTTDPTQDKFQKKDDGCKCSTVNPHSLEMSMTFGTPDTIVIARKMMDVRRSRRGSMMAVDANASKGGSSSNGSSHAEMGTYNPNLDTGLLKLNSPNNSLGTQYIIQPGKVKLHFDAPTPKMFSPQSVNYDFVFESYLTVNRYKFVLRRPNGYEIEFDNTGKPTTTGNQVSYIVVKSSSANPLPERTSSSRITPSVPGDDTTPWTPSGTYFIISPGKSHNTYEQFAVSEDGKTAYYKLVHIQQFGDINGMLILSPTNPKIGIEVIRDGDKAIRQIKSKTDGLTDVIVVDQYKYQIKFYNNGDFGAKVDGLYTINTGATPRETWTIENPQRSDTLIDKVKITKSAGGVDHVYNWEYIEASKTWQIEEGTATEARKSSKVETTNPTTNETTVTTVAKNSQDEVKYKEQETYAKIDDISVIKEKVVDPDGAALKTEFIYNQSGESKGMLAAKKYSGGTWQKYTYDSGQRATTVKMPTKMAAYTSTDTGEMKIVEYSYVSHDANDIVAPNDNRPRIVKERVNGVWVSASYMVDKVEGTERIVIKEQAATPSAAYGTTGNLRTTTVYDTTTGNIKSVTYPDGKKDTYTYEKGNYTPGSQVPGTFTVNANGACTRLIIIHGTTVSQEGIAYKTSKEIIIYDEVNDIVLKELYAYTGSTYEKISWEVYVYDSQHHVTNTYKSNNTQTSATWNCCNKESETLADGSEYTYTYDSLERVKTKTKKGISSSTPDITTTYTYDSESRVTSVSVNDGTNTLTTSTTYDTAGRVTSKTDASGLTTTYAYTSATETTGDIITITYPDGSTKITEKYFDGHVKSITGTAVVATYYDYGAEAGTGYQWARRSVGSFESGRYMKTYRNALGKVAKIEKSGYNGSTVTTQFYYNNYGQLYKKTQTGMADTLYEYDSYGCVSRQGLDVNGNGTLDLASSDRIVESDTVFSLESSDWWLTTTKKIYATANSSATTTTSVSKIRLTGLASGIVSETKSTDINGNETSASTAVNRTTKTITETVNVPDSSVDVQTVAVNGLVSSVRSASNMTTTFSYDGLGRQTGVTDPRTGTTTTAYYTSGTGKIGKVYTVTDAASNTSTYDYDTTSGRLAWTQNALSKKTYYDYNTRGQVTCIWGDTGYPTERTYDSYGQMTSLKTYRAGTGWTGSAWPTATTGTSDTTTWTYDTSSGLVTSKTFADSNSVSYAYTNDGKLYTRTWARTSGGNPLTTTYSYDSNTGEQTGIDYSDSTQDITFSYTRTGQQYQITDSVGTRTFAYNTALQPTTEAIVGGLYSKTLTRSYATTGVVGRYTGMNISSEYTKTLGYDTYGRMNSISDGTDTFSYSFTANSDLVASITRPHNLTTDYAYEANRDMIDYVENKYNTTSISKYDYTNDAIGRRTGKSRTGSAFATTDTVTFGYNDRSEVTSAVSNNITAYNYAFAFDNIGNRSSSTVAGTTATYTANNLNQYTAITQGITINPTYNADGCITNLASANGTWNGENRLVEIYDDTAGYKLEFTYDYQGRRVRKKVYSGSSTTSWTLSADLKFVYDGYKLIEILDGQNSDAILQKFLWSSTPLSVYDASASATYYYFADANKNIGQLMDSSGNTVAKYEYSPFGVQTLSTGTYASTNPFRFSSEYFDTETNLVYYNLRYYSPDLGRWLSRDPIEEAGGNNLYAMVNNNPVNSWDSLGMCDCGTNDQSLDDMLNYWFGSDAIVFPGGAVEDFLDNQPSWFGRNITNPLGDVFSSTLNELWGNEYFGMKALGLDLAAFGTGLAYNAKDLALYPIPAVLATTASMFDGDYSNAARLYRTRFTDAIVPRYGFFLGPGHGVQRHEWPTGELFSFNEVDTKCKRHDRYHLTDQRAGDRNWNSRWDSSGPIGQLFQAAGYAVFGTRLLLDSAGLDTYGPDDKDAYRDYYGY